MYCSTAWKTQGWVSEIVTAAASSAASHAAAAGGGSRCGRGGSGGSWSEKGVTLA
jgi:hypothetical protein